MNRLDIEKHSNSYKKILATIVKNTRMSANSIYIKNIEYKLKQYENILNKCKLFSNKGNKFIEYLEFINESYIEVKNLLENIDDKFLLFVVGTGKYGKSTLINALLQKEVAPVGIIPKTWKIDVYYLDENCMGDVIIKLNDGEILKLKKQEAEEFCNNEEKKYKESIKEFNKIKNKELDKCKTPEEKKEMKEKLKSEYLYKPKIVEVRWPVENNQILKNMLLVDTPGLQQDTLDLNNSIKDYYFKADGVIWMLDASVISSKTNSKMIKELEEYLKELGGINHNIVGVVNKIDTVYNNGGEQAVEAVLNDANSFFGDKFKYIIPISAKDAFKNKNDINLVNLNEKIEEVFLSDSNALKLESKSKGIQKVINDSIKINNEFLNYILEKNEEYDKRKDYIKKFEVDFKKELDVELKKIIKVYLEKVDLNIEMQAKNLFDIQNPSESKSYVIDKIFDLKSFESKLNSFLDNKKGLIEMEENRIYEYSTLSKYKYISNLVKDNQFITSQVKNLNLKINQTFNIYTSLGNFNGESIFDFLGGILNELYRGFMKFLKMDSVKTNLKSTIKEISESSEEDILKLLNFKIEEIVKNSYIILDKSYQSILFKQSEYKKIQSYINIFNEDVLKEIEVKLEDVFY